MQKLKAIFTPFKRSKYNGEQDDSVLHIKCIHCSAEKVDAQTQTNDTVEKYARSVSNQFVQVNLTPSRIPRLVAMQCATESVCSRIVLSSQLDVQKMEREKSSPVFSQASPTRRDNSDRISPKIDIFVLGNEKPKSNNGSDSDGHVSEPEYTFKAEEVPFSSKGSRSRKARQKSHKTDRTKVNESDRRNPASPQLKPFKEAGKDASPPSGIPVSVKGCERSKTYVFENGDHSKSPEKMCEQSISLRPNYKNENNIHLKREKFQQAERPDVISTPKKFDRSYKDTEEFTSREILEADSGAGMACGDDSICLKTCT